MKRPSLQSLRTSKKKILTAVSFMSCSTAHTRRCFGVISARLVLGTAGKIQEEDATRSVHSSEPPLS